MEIKETHNWGVEETYFLNEECPCWGVEKTYFLNAECPCCGCFLEIEGYEDSEFQEGEIFDCPSCKSSFKLS